MGFDVNSFCPEKVVRITGKDSSGKLLYLVNQIASASIKCDGEEVTKKDAQGSTMFSITKAKTCTVDFESSVFDLNLLAQVNGSNKSVATSTTKITAPNMQTIKITSTNATAVVLAESVKNIGTSSTPVYKISVATLTKDGSLKKRFTLGAEASEGVCTYTSGTKTLTFATGDLVEGDTLFVEYKYDTENAVQVINSAEDFPVATETTILVKGYDICDQSTVIYAYIVLPNAKMSVSSTVSFNLEDTLAVTLNCSYDYCSDEKELYRMIVAQ